MELPSKVLEYISCKTPKIEEHMLRVMDKSNLEKHLFQFLVKAILKLNIHLL